ncbi:MAG TPA: hypothetical protein VNJ08_10970 [Bacteriovoracaceae bacterium]|nr:hypothetical protein [Bacteriovoracaceae bacterium]
MMSLVNKDDLIVFSFNHFGSSEVRTTEVITEFALHSRVYFIEAPIIGQTMLASYHIKEHVNEVTIVQPYLPGESSVFEQKAFMLDLLKELISDENLSHYSIWTDSPRAMPFIRYLNAESVIYDCLKNDEDANPLLEKELYEYADVVLTSGMTSHTHQDEMKYFSTNMGNVSREESLY